jgi:hypothetical protein
MEARLTEDNVGPTGKGLLYIYIFVFGRERLLYCIKNPSCQLSILTSDT